MTVAEITIAEKLCQSIKQYMDDYYCLEVLRFFGRHPHARFSELAVVHALNSNPGKFYTRKALRRLADKEVVRISIDNNIILYSLAEDESLRSLALYLAKLDWGQWQLALRQTYPTSGQVKAISDPLKEQPLKTSL